MAVEWQGPPKEEVPLEDGSRWLFEVHTLPVR